jgi:hypothetical protein
MSTFLSTILTHTPIWVWFLLKGLIVLGLVQTRDRRVGQRTVLAMPVGLGVWSLVSAGQAFGWQPPTLALWAGAWALGLVLQPWLMPSPRVQALADGRFAITGSWAPLVLILTIFFIRYSVSACLAVVPELATLPAFSVAACLLYGLPSGLLAARARRVLATQAPAGLAPALQGQAA